MVHPGYIRIDDTVTFQANKGHAHAQWLLAMRLESKGMKFGSSEIRNLLQLAAKQHHPLAQSHLGNRLIMDVGSSEAERIQGWHLLLDASEQMDSALDIVCQNATYFPLQNTHLAKRFYHLLSRKKSVHEGAFAVFEFWMHRRALPSQSFGNDCLSLLQEAKEKGGDAVRVALVWVLFGKPDTPYFEFVRDLKPFVSLVDLDSCYLLALSDYMEAKSQKIPFKENIPALKSLARLSELGHGGAKTMLTMLEATGEFEQLQTPSFIKCLQKLTIDLQSSLSVKTFVSIALDRFTEMLFSVSENNCARELNLTALLNFARISGTCDLWQALGHIVRITSPEPAHTPALTPPTLAECYIKAAERGAVRGTEAIAWMLKDSDPALSHFWFELGVRDQDIRTCYMYGYYLLTEGKRSEDKTKGLSLLYRAYHAGYQDAGLFLSELFCKGEYVPKNNPEALKIAYSLAQSGNNEAMYTLGVYILSGICGIKDNVMGTYWIGKSQDSGYDVIERIFNYSDSWEDENLTPDKTKPSNLIVFQPRSKFKDIIEEKTS